ncbi:MAG: hypothetical protein DME22_25745 [Verrucomicrobia bacterium]|nr:MAG: hypothetical protein DME22_25745 [Verrucomicrobiota bacterium]
MLNHETELKMQAYLDGELASGEANVIRELFERKNVARSPFEGLRVALLAVALFTGGCAHYRVNAPLAAVDPRTGSIAQEQEIDLFATGRVVETTNRDLLLAASPERPAKLVFSENAHDRIVGKRFVFGGPLVALFKSNEPLQTFNPFSVSNTGAEWDRAVLDPYLPPPRGFTLFRLGF